ncbi:MAG: porphobilinogen synthase [Armatimonadota bacterium]|nr:porphobilinogen synthase [Armatimonadota bacterium]
MTFPITRQRRLRATDNIRRMVRETELSVNDLIYPMFVTHGLDVKLQIPSMPGVFHFSVDALVQEAREVYGLGIPAILLFGLPANKDELGSEAYARDGIVQRAVRALKSKVPGLVVITDVCLCEYTSHGHCGVVEEGKVVNDKSLELISRTALSHAEAGADIVAPSDMMDGRVAAIREALDETGYTDTAIMAYSAKYASAFYGPFRDAADSAPQFGDRKSYQMDPANRREAIREITLDLEEGADIIMVKPALSYLDIISDARTITDVPIAAYNVSGEYSMVKAAAANGWIDERRIVMEILTSIKRAGADLILTYHAKDAALWIRERQ